MTTFANVWIFLFGTAANVIGFSPAYWFECFRIGNNEADSFTNMEEFTNSIKIIALNLISTFVFVMFWNLTLGLKVPFTNRPLLGIFVLNGTSALLHQSLGVLYQYSAWGKIDFSLDSANLVAGCAMVGAAAFLTPFIVLFANICLHCIHVLRTEIVSISVAKKKMSYKLDSARCQAAEEYAKRWKPNEYAELADAKTILSFLFEQARMQLPDAMALRSLLEQKEMDKHAFAKIVTWITVIVMTHKKDVAMRAWLLEQAKNVDDGIATLCFSLASECK